MIKPDFPFLPSDAENSPLFVVTSCPSMISVNVREEYDSKVCDAGAGGVSKTLKPSRAVVD